MGRLRGSSRSPSPTHESTNTTAVPTPTPTPTLPTPAPATAPAVSCDILAAEIAVAVNGARCTPQCMGRLISAEDAYIDSDEVLLLPGWQKGIQLQEGTSAYEAAATHMSEQQSTLQPVSLNASLQAAAEAAACRMAAAQDITQPHPPGLGLMQAVQLYAKAGGMVQLNLSSGFFHTGTSVAVSWIVHDGDPSRAHRASLLRPEARHIGIGASTGADGRVYIAGLFADSCWALDEKSCPAAALVSAYDEDGDGFLDYQEYGALCADLALGENLRDVTEPDFALLCRSVNGASLGGSERHTTSGLLTESGLHNLLGGDEFLASHQDLVSRLIAARRAGKAALSQSGCVNLEKQKGAAVPAQLSIDSARVLHRLRKMWHDKPGDILDEMLQNYASPAEGPDGKLMVLAEVAQRLQSTAGEAYPDRNRVELLTMLLYTMAGPDIDAAMGYANVPSYNAEDTSLWEEYSRVHSAARNSALFSAINWAMRAACGAPSEEDSEAWRGVAKWVKTICLLTAMCHDAEVPLGKPLSRGLAGLPQSVSEVHASIAAGQTIDWGAASSCATDVSVAEAYVKGEAANATKGSGSAVLFTITGTQHGLPLQSISKYPKEAEVLLPPLSSFRVFYRGGKKALPGVVCIEMRHSKCFGGDAGLAAELDAFLKECLDESEAAVPRLLKTSETIGNTIPQALAEVVRPATDQYDADFFNIMRRKLRGSSHGGGESSLVGARWRTEEDALPTAKRALPTTPQHSPPGEAAAAVTPVSPRLPAAPVIDITDL